eukprot:gene22744-9175_t
MARTSLFFTNRALQEPAKFTSIKQRSVSSKASSYVLDAKEQDLLYVFACLRLADDETKPQESGPDKARRLSMDWLNDFADDEEMLAERKRALKVRLSQPDI